MTLPPGLVLALTLMTQDERPHMSIVLCDQIGIDALTWSTAKTQATRVFDHAGIHVEWVDLDHGNKQCIPPPMGTHFLVILSPALPKDWIGPDAMGLKRWPWTCGTRSSLRQNNIFRPPTAKSSSTSFTSPNI